MLTIANRLWNKVIDERAMVEALVKKLYFKMKRVSSNIIFGWAIKLRPLYKGGKVIPNWSKDMKQCLYCLICNRYYLPYTRIAEDSRKLPPYWKLKQAGISTVARLQLSVGKVSYVQLSYVRKVKRK